MLTSVSLVILVGLILGHLCSKIKLPRIIGMLAAGILLGPFGANLLDKSILNISGDLRQAALVIILIKAGLSLNLDDLKKIGRPAVLMSFLPALLEVVALIIFGPALLGITRIEAAILGAVLGAVSPAVVVPRMVELMEKRYGTDKRIPQMILAGSSLDDVFVIVLFATFISIAQGGEATLKGFVDIPVSITLGILVGAVVGAITAYSFEKSFKGGHLIRNSVKTIILLTLSFLMLTIEQLLKGTVAFSGLLAVMSMSLVIAMKSEFSVSERLREKFGKLWIAAEIVLFVLVGAEVDIRYTLTAGFGALAVIALGLLLRSIGVLLCLPGMGLNKKEMLYCIIAYLPKATVQAAIGSVPLSLGLPCGKIVLSVAVLSILTTAPLGAIGMDLSYKRLLTYSDKEPENGKENKDTEVSEDENMETDILPSNCEPVLIPIKERDDQ